MFFRPIWETRGERVVFLYSIYSTYAINDVYNPRSTIMCASYFSITIGEVARALRVISISS